MGGALQDAGEVCRVVATSREVRQARQAVQVMVSIRHGLKGEGGFTKISLIFPFDAHPFHLKPTNIKGPPFLLGLLQGDFSI